MCCTLSTCPFTDTTWNRRRVNETYVGSRNVIIAGWTTLIHGSIPRYRALGVPRSSSGSHLVAFPSMLQGNDRHMLICKVGWMRHRCDQLFYLLLEETAYQDSLCRILCRLKIREHIAVGWN